MSAKQGDTGSRAVKALAGMGAAFVARKVIIIVGKKLTGREPPDPEDPQVALSEALVWGIVIAVGVHTARVLATRAATRRLHTGAEQPAP